MSLDDAIANKLSHAPVQESGLVMREFTEAFRSLASTQREAVLFSVLEGWSYRQIADFGGVSVGTVKSRVSRGRTMLRQILIDDRSSRDAASGAERRFARNLSEAGAPAR